MEKKLIALLIFLLINLNVYGQKRLSKLITHPEFEWLTDSIGSDIILYYEPGSYMETHLPLAKERIQFHYSSTLNFIEADSFPEIIHYFVLENRSRMEKLTGVKTNGLANYKENYVTAIFSKEINSTFSNHELFHVIAMNEWGAPQTWVNEGMAVYSDRYWHSYPLHELAKFLVDQDKAIPTKKLVRNFRRHDTMISYPQMGSFVMYLEEAYGREKIRRIWNSGRRGILKTFEKPLDALEQDWLNMLETVETRSIIYLGIDSDKSVGED